MSFYLPFILGFIILLAITIYFSFWLSKRKTIAVRKEIFNGSRKFLIHWTYNSMNFGDFQGKGSAFNFYKKKLSNVKEVYICEDGILVGDVIFYSWNRFAEFKKLEITTDNPPCILFKIEYEVGDTSSIAEFSIPIPAGKVHEAESVLQTLYGIVRFDS